MFSGSNKEQPINGEAFAKVQGRWINKRAREIRKGKLESSRKAPFRCRDERCDRARRTCLRLFAVRNESRQENKCPSGTFDLSKILQAQGHFTFLRLRNSFIRRHPRRSAALTLLTWNVKIALNCRKLPRRIRRQPRGNRGKRSGLPGRIVRVCKQYLRRKHRFYPENEVKTQQRERIKQSHKNRPFT